MSEVINVLRTGSKALLPMPTETGIRDDRLDAVLLHLAEGNRTVDGAIEGYVDQNPSSVLGRVLRDLVWRNMIRAKKDGWHLTGWGRQRVREIKARQRYA